MIQIGGCHWQRADPQEERAHLWVIISTPDEEGFVHVNFTSPGSYLSETTCIITPGQCGFLSHDSLVAYQKIEVITATDYASRLAQGLLFASSSAGGPASPQ